MTQRLKSWESPRSEGRNDKGKGGSARQRQRKKQLQMLRKKLKEGNTSWLPDRYADQKRSIRYNWAIASWSICERTDSVSFIEGTIILVP